MSSQCFYLVVQKLGVSRNALPTNYRHSSHQQLQPTPARSLTHSLTHSLDSEDQMDGENNKNKQQGTHSDWLSTNQLSKNPPPNKYAETSGDGWDWA
ncbi:unnamed protein product [Heterobilharzia americana]|nr:unnamed protein product [Heterobilharzia americana]